MTRKTPIRHKVRKHRREGKTIKSFERGSGKKYQRPRKVVGKGVIRPKTYKNYRYFHGTPYVNFKSIMNKGIRPNEAGWTYLSEDFMSASAFGDFMASHSHFVEPSPKIVTFAFDTIEYTEIGHVKGQPDLRVRTDKPLRPIAFVVLDRDIPNREDWFLEEFTEIT